MVWGVETLPIQFKENVMLNEALNVLQSLGVLTALQFIGVAVAAIFIYRYFTDRS